VKKIEQNSDWIYDRKFQSVTVTKNSNETAKITKTTTVNKTHFFFKYRIFKFSVDSDKPNLI